MKQSMLHQPCRCKRRRIRHLLCLYALPHQVCNLLQLMPSRLSRAQPLNNLLLLLQDSPQLPLQALRRTQP